MDIHKYLKFDLMVNWFLNFIESILMKFKCASFHFEMIIQAPIKGQIIVHFAMMLKHCNNFSLLWCQILVQMNDFSLLWCQIHVQMNNFSIEQDICNLRKECEEKDATIKELTTLVQSTNVTGSKVFFFLFISLSFHIRIFSSDHD